MSKVKPIQEMQDFADRKMKKIQRKYLKQASDGSGHTYSNMGEIQWGKLDNTAHLFPVIAGEGMSNVYRISAYLKEEIDRDLLQKSLDIILPKFPVFNSRMRQGMFWYYFEENGKRSPKVVEENDYPCVYIEENRNRNYMFRVSYYKKKINLEIFHVLTDGQGGQVFLKELVYQYLRLAHKELGEQYPDYLSDDVSLSEEDSYLANFKKFNFTKGYKHERAYILKGPIFGAGKMGVLHGHMKIQAIKELAKKYDASINEYLVSVFIWSVYMEYLKGMPSKQPITISVPVNLRPFFDSRTMKNFFVMVTAVFRPVRENQPFEDVLESVKESLREQITKEHLEKVLSYNVTGEQFMILRTIPLIFKKPGIKSIYKMAARANTATITNLGIVEVRPEYKPYIENFTLMLSRSAGQNLKLALMSYEDQITATFSSVMKDVRLQKTFFRYLADQGIEINIESNGVYYE